MEFDVLWSTDNRSLVCESLSRNLADGPLCISISIIRIDCPNCEMLREGDNFVDDGDDKCGDVDVF